MATVKAFRALRYTNLTENCVAPPYDVIGPDERARLGARCEYNIVHLTLPEGGNDKYAQAATRLQKWLAEGAVGPDEQPSFYRYQQRFGDPLSGQTLTRTGYYVALHTEPYEKGIVLPHEHTFPGIKEDRFRLVEATRTHLESIFGLYENTPTLRAALENAPFEPVAHLKGEHLPEGFEHRLERVSDPAAVQEIVAAFEPVRIWIADGHHRYETALRFGMEYGSEGSPERFMPILLVPMDDRGLSILPTHRLLKEAPPGTPEDWRSALSGTFQVRVSSAATILEEMEETADTGREGIGFVFGKEVWLLVPRSDLDLNAYMPAEASDAWKWLDANLLHRVLLPALGCGQMEPTYTRSVQEALSRIRSSEYGAAFLLNPPTLFSLQQIAQGGEKMPHKSTYFYPKVLSGLVMWRIE